MTRYCREVKELIKELITDLMDNIFEREEEKSDMIKVKIFFMGLPEDRTMHHVINKILPHKKMIKNRNLDFFLENRHLFSGLSEEKIDYYINYIIKDTSIPDETREVIWTYFDELIRYAEKYKKLK